MNFKLLCSSQEYPWIQLFLESCSPKGSHSKLRITSHFFISARRRWTLCYKTLNIIFYLAFVLWYYTYLRHTGVHKCTVAAFNQDILFQSHQKTFFSHPGIFRPGSGLPSWHRSYCCWTRWLWGRSLWWRSLLYCVLPEPLISVISNKHVIKIIIYTEKQAWNEEKGNNKVWLSYYLSWIKLLVLKTWVDEINITVKSKINSSNNVNTHSFNLCIWVLRIILLKQYLTLERNIGTYTYLHCRPKHFTYNYNIKFY